MSRLTRNRLVRLLDEAEGYLLLELPVEALQILDSVEDWPGLRFEANLLRGEALRALGRHHEAIEPLEQAAALHPDDLGTAICLAWCYKRTHRLAHAIHVLERAASKHADEAIVHYNLACYWSLAGNLSKALERLATALALDPEYRFRIDDEPDFDNLRSDPRFESLLSHAGDTA